MSDYGEQVVAAVRAATIRSPTRYAWLGRVSRPLSTSHDAEMTGPERRRYLVSCLREELYSSFYCRGAPVPARWGEPEPAVADPWLQSAMSQANAGRGSWEPGWTVERLEGDQAVVATPRLRARVAKIDCRAVAGSVRPGATVSIRLPKELPWLSPGFYTVVSEAVPDAASSAGLIRVYWNVGRAGAPVLVRTLSSWLNAQRVPFRLKVGDHPFRLDRCDAAVLYLRSETFPPLRDPLRRVAIGLAPHLRPQVPAFTLELVPGVGLAEDDATGESFGVRRCELLADAIVRAHEHGLVEVAARVGAVAARFAEDGVELEAPYLEPSLAGRHVL
jgi:hypothetical protein